MTRKMYIPELGDRIELAEDWSFKLQYEYRTSLLWKAMALPYNSALEYWPRDKAQADIADLQHRGIEISVNSGLWETFSIKVMLPKRTILKVDRIYIRKGNEQYSSVSFYIEKTSLQFVPTKPNPKMHRFWAKLADVNTMVLTDDVSPTLLVPVKKKPSRYIVRYRVTQKEIDKMDPWRRNRYNEDLIAYNNRTQDHYWYHNPSIMEERRETIKDPQTFIEAMKKEHPDLIDIYPNTIENRYGFLHEKSGAIYVKP